MHLPFWISSKLLQHCDVLVAENQVDESDTNEMGQEPDHGMQVSFGLQPDLKLGRFNIKSDIDLTSTLLLDVLVNQPWLSLTQADISNAQAPEKTPNVNSDWYFWYLS